MTEILLGSHCKMSGKEMFLGSAKEADSYGANVFMVYTGAPQNTVRKKVSELFVEEGHAYMKEHGIRKVVIHAPYIINLGNTVKPEIYRLAKDFLAVETERTIAMGSDILVLHPGSAVGAKREDAIDFIAEGLNEILTPDMNCSIALETMAGKGSEIGCRFEEIRAIMDEKQCYRLKDLAVDGRDIIDIYEASCKGGSGALAGRRVGEILEGLLGEVIDGSLPNEKEALAARAAELLNNHK